MNPSFNLIDEPWIPCVLAPGEQADLSLREAVARAAEITEIVAENPPITAALHRLLLAVLHRCFGPESVGAWSDLWHRGAFDSGLVSIYLEKWRSRFDLFDGRWPFYQTVDVADDDVGSVAKLLLQADNNPTLFDHAVSDAPPELEPAQAARLLLSIQGFDTGGMKTGRGAEKFAKAGPLIQCAVCLVRGQNLFETLMLNLHRYRPEDSEPFSFDRSIDAPAWEHEERVRPADRYPNGYLDLLTWQSRRARLLPDTAGARVVVRRAALMKGYQFPQGFDRHTRETMVAFRRNTAKNAPDPWPPVGFREERALWRDGPAFMQSLAEVRQRPKTIDWLAELSAAGAVPRSASVRIELLGLATDRAKLLFWRHERLEVPTRYLEDSEGSRYLVGRLREALDLAEHAGRLLEARLVEIRSADKPTWTRSPMRVLAEELLGANGLISDLIEHLAPERGYWPRLEEPFRILLDALPNELTLSQRGEPELRGEVFPSWAAAVEAALQQAFREATEGLESSAKGMRAVARAERQLGWRLAELMAPYRTPAGGGVA